MGDASIQLRDGGEGESREADVVDGFTAAADSSFHHRGAADRFNTLRYQAGRITLTEWMENNWIHLHVLWWRNILRLYLCSFILILLYKYSPIPEEDQAESRDWLCDRDQGSPSRSQTPSCPETVPVQPGSLWQEPVLWGRSSSPARADMLTWIEFVWRVRPREQLQDYLFYFRCNIWPPLLTICLWLPPRPTAYSYTNEYQTGFVIPLWIWQISSHKGAFSITRENSEKVQLTNHLISWICSFIQICSNEFALLAWFISEQNCI